MAGGRGGGGGGGEGGGGRGGGGGGWGGGGGGWGGGGVGGVCALTHYYTTRVSGCENPYYIATSCIYIVKI